MKIYVDEINTMSSEELANSIVMRACKDYKRAVNKVNKDPYDISQLIIKTEIEEFFLADWFCVLTDLDGEIVLNRLNQSLE